MIRRHNFFKRIITGSIVALQLSAIAPAYNVLAVGQNTNKTPVKYSLQSNAEVNKKTGEVERGKIDLEAKLKSYDTLIRKYWKDIDNKYDEIQHNKETLKNLDLTSYISEGQGLEDKVNKLEKLNEKLLKDVSEITKKLEKVVSEKSKIDPVAQLEYYDTLIRKYWKDIDDKYNEIESNKEILNNIDLTSYISGQASEDKVNKLEKLNKKLLNDISEITKKLEKIVPTRNKIAKDAGRDKGFRNP